MNAQPEQEDFVENSAYNPFPEPQTIPAGWDLSELNPPQTDSSLDEEDSTQS